MVNLVKHLERFRKNVSEQSLQSVEVHKALHLERWCQATIVLSTALHSDTVWNPHCCKRRVFKLKLRLPKAILSTLCTLCCYCMHRMLGQCAKGYFTPFGRMNSCNHSHQKESKAQQRLFPTAMSPKATFSWFQMMPLLLQEEGRWKCEKWLCTWPHYNQFIWQQIALCAMRGDKCMPGWLLRLSTLELCHSF